MEEKKSILLVGIFIIYSSLIEGLTLFRMGFKPYSNHFYLNLLLFIIIGSFIFNFKTARSSYLYLFFWVGLFSLLYLTNQTMLKMFGNLFSIEQLFLISEGTEVFTWDFLPRTDLIIAILLIFGFGFILIILHLLTHQTKACNYKLFIMILILACTAYNSISHVIKQNVKINGQTFSESFYISTLKKRAYADYGFSLYLKEGSNYLRQILLPVKAQLPNTKNETTYTGLLEGMNVITIMLESAQEVAIDPFLTPNLFRLQQEGIAFTNFYSVNKTNVSEQIGITGNYPTIPYPINLLNYDLFFSLPNLLKEEYETQYFHDNNGSFYLRGKMMADLGFKSIYLHGDLFPELLPNWQGEWSWRGDFTPDSVMVDKIIPYILETKAPFYSFWTTLSTHGPYENSSYSNRDNWIKMGYFATIETALANGIWENPLQDNNLAFQFKYYQAAMMDLDVAIGKLLNALDEAGILDNTLIVIYNDHHLYYHDLHLHLNHLTSDESYQMDKLYKGICYMWNPTLNQRIYTDYGTTEIPIFTSPYIIVPTILDLLGIQYNTYWYVSESVFSEDYLPVFYSHQLKAVMNDKLYTLDAETIFYGAQPVSKTEEAKFLTDCLRLLERLHQIDILYFKYK